MKYTLFLTHSCNLACDYCYVGKEPTRMSLESAQKVIDFALTNTPPEENIDIGFFGGEPLLEFPLLTEITTAIESHPRHDAERVKLGLVTNGTLLTPEILAFVDQHHIALTISCDGPPDIHDRIRRYPNGEPSSAAVEQSIRLALDALGAVPVNAVYQPSTVEHLSRTVDYLSSLGVRQIYLNPDFSADWTAPAVAKVPGAYGRLAKQYMNYYREGRPHFISPLDGKLTVILRGGYQAKEKCRMGYGEFAFAASGRVYPCERLASRDAETHEVGRFRDLIQVDRLRNHHAPGPPINEPCVECGLRAYCVNWCGCSNYFMTGYYNRVSPFLCTSEQAWIRLALEAFKTLESELGPTFMEHVGGHGLLPSLTEEEPTSHGHRGESHHESGRSETTREFDQVERMGAHEQ